MEGIMKKTILYLSLALGICLPALAMNQEDADLKRALQESARMAEERIMRESKQTAHEQQRRQEDPELHHALELSRAGLQAEDTFQKELKQAKELSLKESGVTRERAAFSRAIGRSVHDSILARIESSESENL